LQGRSYDGKLIFYPEKLFLASTKNQKVKTTGNMNDHQNSKIINEQKESYNFVQDFQPDLKLCHLEF
jgi:exopolysaccharide biosynthesis predicted pyruvyltransferase EpsI